VGGEEGWALVVYTRLCRRQSSSTATMLTPPPAWCNYSAPLAGGPVFSHTPIPITMPNVQICDWAVQWFVRDYWALEHFIVPMIAVILLRAADVARDVSMLVSALIVFFCGWIYEAWEEWTAAQYATGALGFSGKDEYDPADAILWDPIAHVCGIVVAWLLLAVVERLANMRSARVFQLRPCAGGSRTWGIVIFRYAGMGLFIVGGAAVTNLFTKALGTSLTAQDALFRGDWILITLVRLAYYWAGGLVMMTMPPVRSYIASLNGYPSFYAYAVKESVGLTNAIVALGIVIASVLPILQFAPPNALVLITTGVVVCVTGVIMLAVPNPCPGCMPECDGSKAMLPPALA